MSTTTPPVDTSDAAPVGIPDAANESLADYGRRWWAGVRTGDLGSLPIVVGLILIAVIFQAQNSQFLTAGNFVNLIVQMAAITIIGMGIVFVLLLGEIDLSVGYVSGVAGVTTALLMNPDGHNVFGAGPAIFVALAVGLSIGIGQGLIITKIGVPSFVVTLAGLLAWNGVVLLLIGDKGTVIIQNSVVVGFANDFLPAATAWIVLVAGIALYAGILMSGDRTRRKAGLPTEPIALYILRVGGLAVAGAVVVGFANQDRGIPYVFLVITGLYILWTFVLNRTRFGRHIYAVGGNAEAARRAGINVDNVKIACFGICSMMAALGGIVLASRLRSIDTNSGGGTILLYSIAAAVIGGTSLFGGRGSIIGTVIGALIVGVFRNGLALSGLELLWQDFAVGVLIIVAVTIDQWIRKISA
jgi:D-xylose transport system permease protein